MEKINKNKSSKMRLFTLIGISIAVTVSFLALQGSVKVNAQTCYEETGSRVTCPDVDTWSAGECYSHVYEDQGEVWERIDCPAITFTPSINSSGTFTQKEDNTDTTDSCGGVDVAVNVNCDSSNDNPIIVYLIAIINFLAAGVGLVVMIMIAVGGVQYMMAGGNPQKTQEAITRIINAVLGLAVFLFMYAFLQWIVPGGFF